MTMTLTLRNGAALLLATALVSLLLVGGCPPGQTTANNDTPDANNPTTDPNTLAPTDGGDQPKDDATTQVAFTIDPNSLQGYLLAFHACDPDTANCDDPQNHRVYLATGPDGVNWSLVSGWQAYQGSVPDVVERSGTIYIYTPNRVVRVDLTTGEVTEPMVVALDSGGQLDAGFVDPSPMLDSNGRIVVFFVAGSLTGAIGTCSDDETTCTATVLSMTEVDGSDGTEFELDSGARATVDIDTSGDIKTSTDPDIYYDGSKYILYDSHGPSMSVWTSTELRGTYTNVAGLPNGCITWATGGVGCGLYDSATARYWTYAHADVSGVSVLRRAVHADFSAQLTDGDFDVMLTGPDVGLSAGAGVYSPGIWKRE